MGNIWTLCMSKDCRTPWDIPCVVRVAWEIWRATLVILWYKIVCIYMYYKCDHFLVCNNTWQQNSRTLWLHTTHQTKALLPTMHHFVVTWIFIATKLRCFSVCVSLALLSAPVWFVSCMCKSCVECSRTLLSVTGTFQNKVHCMSYLSSVFYSVVSRALSISDWLLLVIVLN